MKTYHITTFGCQMNESDSERLAGLLGNKGYKYIDNKYQADLVVINTCGVRQSAENRIYGLIPRIKKENKKAEVILTGCLSERKDVKRRLEKYVDEWMQIKEIFNFQFSIFNEFSKINFQKDVQNKNDYLSIKPKYNSKFSALVPIGNGCNNFCSYCVVPYARGREVYRKADDILNEVKNLVDKGYKEIILIAQNVNSYRSGKIDFADLLNMVNNIKGNFWVRFFTSHPKDMSAKLIKTMAQCQKVCHQVHLPAQAGDNEVLKKMNRKYTIEHYISLIKKIRIVMPDASITTDLIVGFPGETKKQFNNSVKLFKQVKFDMAYLAQYSSRPGTEAAKLKDNVSRQEKRRREEELNEVLKKTAFFNNKKYLGKTIEVLIDGKNKAGDWLARTGTGKLTVVEDSESIKGLVGKFVKVMIVKARDFGLEGEIIK